MCVLGSSTLATGAGQLLSTQGMECCGTEWYIKERTPWEEDILTLDISLVSTPSKFERHMHLAELKYPKV